MWQSWLPPSFESQTHLRLTAVLIVEIHKNERWWESICGTIDEKTRVSPEIESRSFISYWRKLNTRVKTIELFPLMLIVLDHQRVTHSWLSVFRATILPCVNDDLSSSLKCLWLKSVMQCLCHWDDQKGANMLIQFLYTIWSIVVIIWLEGKSGREFLKAHTNETWK